MFIGILVTLHSSFFGLPSTISGGNPLEIYIDSVFFVIWIVFTILFIWFRGIIVSNHQEIINFNREKNHIFGILINASSVYFFLIAFVVIIIFLNLKFSIFTLIFTELLILQFHWINSAISNLPYKQVNIRVNNEECRSIPTFSHVFIFGRGTEGEFIIIDENNRIFRVMKESIISIEQVTEQE